MIKGKGSLRIKKDRHDRLVGLLRSDNFWTASDLAYELDTSLRTLMRDLQELRDAGYPIESDRGRGGGISLVGRWGLDQFHISNKEAISLLLCLSMVEAMTPIANELGAKQLKQKIASSFPEPQRKLIIELRKRILIGETASSQVLSNFKKVEQNLLDGVMLAFFESKRIRIQYKDEKSKLTTRDLDPHFLLVNWPVWYLLGWDYLRLDVRIFRIDRISSIVVLKSNIARRSNSIFLTAYEDYFKYL